MAETVKETVDKVEGGSQEPPKTSTKKKTQDKPVVKFARLSKSAKYPVQGSKTAEGFDLYIDHMDLKNPDCVTIFTGIAVDFPEGFYGELHIRSSMGKRIKLLNNVGIIDNDYRGELILKVAPHKSMDSVQSILKEGDRVAQLLIKESSVGKFKVEEVEETSALSETERGSGGFGSTGVK